MCGEVCVWGGSVCGEEVCVGRKCVCGETPGVGDRERVCGVEWDQQVISFPTLPNIQF